MRPKGPRAAHVPALSGTEEGGVPGHVLDNPVRASLTGPHSHFAEGNGSVLRYPVDVAPWWALPDDPRPGDWTAAAALAGPGRPVMLAGPGGPPPEGWEVQFRLPGVQLVADDSLMGAPDAETVRLGRENVPEMLGLVERTRPGPFLPRTVEMGTYLGIRRGGALVAMVGERLRPPGWTEISAVCTDEEARGQGLARRLMLAVTAGIRARGEVPFLHAAADNTSAIALYESMGFRLRRTTAFVSALAPGDARLPLPTP